LATNSQNALARVSDRPLRCRRSPGVGACRRMEQTVAVGPQVRDTAARKSRQALARSGGSRTTLPARLNRRGLSSLYRHTRVGRPRPVEPRQDLVAGMVSHSGYVGRCRTGYDHIRDDVEVAQRARDETWPRRRSQNSPSLAHILENYVRHEGRSNGRSINGDTKLRPYSPLAAMVRRRGGTSGQNRVASRLSRLSVHRCGGMGYTIFSS